MKKYLSIVVLASLFLSNINLLKAEDLLPSDAYYKENIAVNEVSAQSPSLRAPDPSIPNPGGTASGPGDFVGGSIGDALYPLLAAGLLYGSVILFRRRKALK